MIEAMFLLQRITPYLQAWVEEHEAYSLFPVFERPRFGQIEMNVIGHLKFF